MPFGVAIGLAEFQGMIQDMFKDCLWQNAFMSFLRAVLFLILKKISSSPCDSEFRAGVSVVASRALRTRRFSASSGVSPAPRSEATCACGSFA